MSVARGGGACLLLVQEGYGRNRRESQKLRCTIFLSWEVRPWAVTDVYQQLLRLARAENQSEDTPREKYDAHCPGSFLAMFSLHADFGVSDVAAAVLAVRNR